MAMQQVTPSTEGSSPPPPKQGISQYRPHHRKRGRNIQQWMYLSVLGFASLLSILSVIRFTDTAYQLMDYRPSPEQQHANDSDDDDPINTGGENRGRGQPAHPQPDRKSIFSSLPSLLGRNQQTQDQPKQQRKLPPNIHHQLPKGGRRGSGGANTVQAVERKLDTSFELSFDMDDGVTVQVGKQGEAVRRAILNGMLQKNQGLHRSQWERIETSICLTTDDDDDDDYGNGTGTASFIQSRNSNNNRDAQNPIEYLPEAILIGVQKGGTTALYNYLDQHPDIAKATKELYFVDEKIDTIVTVAGIPQTIVQRSYGQVMQRALKDPLQDQNKMILDLTPNYMFYSDRVPQRIQCVAPKAKLFALLRNPIDRARSQYDMKIQFFNGKTLNQYGQPIPTFDEYIRNDLEALKETGVVQDWNVVDFNSFFESKASEEAWRTYINSGLNAPIGMSLYSMQLRNYPKIHQGHSRDGAEASEASSFMAISSEQLQYNTSETFGKVLKFLNLPPHEVVFPKTINSSKRKETISESTRILLSEVFRPFNIKLGELLGGEWPNIVTKEWN